MATDSSGEAGMRRVIADETHMRRAIAEAREGIRTRNGEVGVVIVDRSGSVVYAGCNTMNSTRDVTGHAEITGLRAVSSAIQRFDLSDYTLYSTLEPCGMCTCACIWARIRRIVYGAGHEHVPSEYFELIGLYCEDMIARASYRPAISGGVLVDECVALCFDPTRTRLNP